MDKPTIEQTAWVFEQLRENMRHKGSFRYLIYDLMDYGLEAYEPLYKAGGMKINNRITDEDD
jgi:hypothetical protein